MQSGIVFACKKPVKLPKGRFNGSLMLLTLTKFALTLELDTVFNTQLGVVAEWLKAAVC